MPDYKYTYYYSDPDSTDPRMHHLPWPSNLKLDESELPYRVHATKPPEDMEDPVWDFRSQGWADKKEKTLLERSAILEQDVKTLRTNLETQNKAVEQATKANGQAQQTLQGLMQGQAQTTQMLGQILPAIQNLSSFAKELQTKNSEASKSETTEKPETKEEN